MDKGLIALVLLTAVITTDALGDNTVTIDGVITDWADEFCVADPEPAGCDDYPGQQDGKGACIASNWVSPGPADTVYLRYDFDEVGANGANTIDGCWLIDVNQNGNSDRALCFTIASSGGLANAITTGLFTCNDSTVSCGQQVEVASSAVCAINNAVADASQLADCDVADVDLAVECSAPLADLGWTTGVINLVQGCSSTAAQPNSSTFDCFGSPAEPLIIDPTGGGNLPVELQYFGIE